MATNKLSAILFVLGSMVTLSALVWWRLFYGAIASKMQVNLGDVLSCVYSWGGVCRFVRAFAEQMFKKTPYTPLVFWIGIGILACGILVRFFVAKRVRDLFDA